MHFFLKGELYWFQDVTSRTYNVLKMIPASASKSTQPKVSPTQSQTLGTINPMTRCMPGICFHWSLVGRIVRFWSTLCLDSEWQVETFTCVQCYCLLPEERAEPAFWRGSEKLEWKKKYHLGTPVLFFKRNFFTMFCLNLHLGLETNLKSHLFQPR